MVNKVRVTIAGAPYAIATTDSEKYIASLAKRLDEDITKLLDTNENLSVTKAAVFCAMDYLDEYKRAPAAPRICAARYRTTFPMQPRRSWQRIRSRRRTRPSSGKMPLCGNSWPSCSRSDLHYISVKGRACLLYTSDAADD